MILPIFQTNIRELSMMQTSWSQDINPIISNPILAGNLLTNIVLKTGINQINHLLDRKPQGYIITRMIDGFVQIYDTQNSNQMPTKTLTLVSSGNGNIDLLVY